jgi:hypothetical protein
MDDAPACSHKFFGKLLQLSDCQQIGYGKADAAFDDLGDFMRVNGARNQCEREAKENIAKLSKLWPIQRCTAVQNDKNANFFYL